MLKVRDRVLKTLSIRSVFMKSKDFTGIHLNILKLPVFEENTKALGRTLFQIRIQGVEVGDISDGYLILKIHKVTKNKREGNGVQNHLKEGHESYQ